MATLKRRQWVVFWLPLSQPYSQICQTSKLERKRSISDVWQGSEYAYIYCWIWTGIAN